MSKRNDLTGQVFGRLTVSGLSHVDGRRNTCWKCRCSCGKIIVSYGYHLKSGCTTSCGCYREDNMRARKTKHGLSASPEYNTWRHMKRRCKNPNDKRYDDYGGRGIAVCSEWESFENFYADMGPKPTPNHSIERKDNNGPYCKDNCIWATPEEQNNNQRSNRFITYEGITLTVAQWSHKLGMSYKTLHDRLTYGWSIEKVLFHPVRKR